MMLLFLFVIANFNAFNLFVHKSMCMAFKSDCCMKVRLEGFKVKEIVCK